MSKVNVLRYNPMDPAQQQDPFPYYAELRDTAAVYLGSGGMYFVSRHDAVVEVLRQPNLFSSQWGNTAGPPPIEGAREELADILADSIPAVSTMLTLDPPQQTRYRKTVRKAFSTRRIAVKEPRVREIALDLLGEWPESGRVDFMRTMSIPFPVRVIADMLDIPVEREADVKRWSDDSVAAIGKPISKERGLEAVRGIVEMQKYLATLVEDRRSNPRGDFLSEIAAADFVDVTDTERKLEIPEMLSIIQQLMVAGNEATTKGITEIMKLLIENPDVWKEIKRNPSLIPAMIEEGLRLASPNQGLFRVCTEDSEVDGTKIPKGSMLWVMFASANRDERVFPDPDRFDLTRTNLADSLAFGRGAHFCIGARLARLELKVLFGLLAEQIDEISFAPGTTLEYEPSFILRGLRNLEMDITRPQS